MSWDLLRLLGPADATEPTDSTEPTAPTRLTEQTPPAAGWAADRPARDVTIAEGPALLAHLQDGPSYSAHRARFGAPADVDLQALVELARQADLRGRGGAGFPFAVKLATAARRRRAVVVVNAAEGEPASAKDSALLTCGPHRVLDGAALAARALGTREVHVVTAADRSAAGAAVRTALAERRDARDGLRWSHTEAAARFVSGQARAVVELLSGRTGLPVTSWEPEAVSGVRGRPTLLSNAETFAQLAAVVRLGTAAYARLGTPDEPGTTLVTLAHDATRRVVEVGHGTPWEAVLTEGEIDGALLTGGYHGTWVPPGALRGLGVSRRQLAAHHWSFGAGVVLSVGGRGCPVDVTVQVVDYLAAQSAQRCGPCLNGLPALADALADAVSGRGGLEEVTMLAGLVERRGACAHPDGTVRLVRSLLDTFPDEVAAHARGRCEHRREPGR